MIPQMATKMGNLMPSTEPKLRFFRPDIDKLLATGLAATALFIAAAASGEEAAGPPATKQVETHVHNYGDRNSACLRWSDQCRTCSRSSGGDPVCSNIGIACQPVAVQCLENGGRNSEGRPNHGD